MYDTINLRIKKSEANGVNFINETPRYMNDIGEHNYSGEIVITGDIEGLKVCLNSYQLKIKDGSLCKWYLGDNFKTLGRSDTQRAIEKISDLLHLPMEKAVITRMDIAQNFIMKYDPIVYINHLGTLKYAKRLQETNGIYYSYTDGRLCFYDKNKEQREKRLNIPELYKGRNVLRYEQRYIRRLAKQFRVEAVTGALLYNEDFYTNIIDKWEKSYFGIQKINNPIINIKVMKNKKDLYRMGVIALVDLAGGETNIIEQINEEQKRGELTNKQAYDLREAVKEACTIKSGLTAQYDDIQELDRKIKEAVKYYR